MREDQRYLKEMSRALSGIYLLQKLGAQPSPPKRRMWVRVACLVMLAALALSGPYVVANLRAKHEHAPAAEGEESLGIQRLIRQVQKELTKSEQERRANNIPSLGPVKNFELDITLVAKKAETLGGGLHFTPVTAEDQLQTATEKTHTLKIFMDVEPLEGSAGKSEAPPPAGGLVLDPAPSSAKATHRKKGRNR